MHVCFLGEINTPDTRTGGIGTYLSIISPALVAAGHQVSIISTYYEKKGTEIIDGYTIHWVPRSKMPSPLKGIIYYRQLNKAIRDIHRLQPIDIIETQEHGLSFLEKLPGIKYLIRLHGGHYFFCDTLNQPFQKRKGLIEKKSFTKADAIIGVSNFVIEITSKYHQFGNRKTPVIPYPINTKLFSSSGQVNPEPHLIHFAGSLIKKKGVFELIKAMKLVTDKYPDAVLELYGRDTIKDTGTSCQQQLQALVEELGLTNIKFMGAVANTALPLAISRAEVCVYPSHSETQGIVVLEAMSLSKPVVFAGIGPGKETITHGLDGLLCDPFSPEDIAAKIIEVFDNPAKSIEMGAAARQKILQKYELEIIAQKNLAFYAEMMNDRPQKN